MSSSGSVITLRPGRSTGRRSSRVSTDTSSGYSVTSGNSSSGSGFLHFHLWLSDRHGFQIVIFLGSFEGTAPAAASMVCAMFVLGTSTDAFAPAGSVLLNLPQEMNCDSTSCISKIETVLHNRLDKGASGLRCLQFPHRNLQDECA